MTISARLNRRRQFLLGALPFMALGRRAYAGSITDAKGIAVSATAPKRIVAIGSSVTEIIVGLGRAYALAAIDSTSLTVPGAHGLTDIGYMRSLSVEGVLSQSPDLICATSDSGPPEVIDALRASGVPLAIIPHVTSLAGILDKIRLLGALLDSAGEAASMLDEVERRAKQLESMTAGLASRPKVLFILSLADNRLLAGGAGTGAHTVITMAGGLNVAAGMQGYKPFATEAVLADPPDAIVMMTGGGHAPRADDVFAHTGLASSPAAARRALHVFDGSYLLGFGPRTIAAASELAALLHPNLRP